jgi:hypothetical protein
MIGRFFKRKRSGNGTSAENRGDERCIPEPAREGCHSMIGPSC